VLWFGFGTFVHREQFSFTYGNLHGEFKSGFYVFFAFGVQINEALFFIQGFCLATYRHDREVGDPTVEIHFLVFLNNFFTLLYGRKRLFDRLIKTELLVEEQLLEIMPYNARLVLFLT